MVKVLVILKNGCIQEVQATDHNTEIYVVDLDESSSQSLSIYEIDNCPFTYIPETLHECLRIMRLGEEDE